MNVKSEFCLKQSEKFYVVEVDGANLLYKPTGQKALHLDQTASIVWRLCDGSRTAKQVIDEMSSFYPDQKEAVASDVKDTLEQLRSHGAILTDRMKQ